MNSFSERMINDHHFRLQTGRLDYIYCCDDMQRNGSQYKQNAHRRRETIEL